MNAEEYARGLRDLADWVEAHPELAKSLTTDAKVSAYGVSGAAEAVAWARAMAPVEKDYGDPTDRSALFKLKRAFGPVTLQAVFWRHKVCERIVTGKRTVVEMVPDPTVEVPLVERRREEEIVRWECEPLLAMAEPDMVAAADAELGARVGLLDTLAAQREDSLAERRLK